MHPIERLRYVARAAGDDGGLLAREAAGALAAFADDPSALVTACRRLVDRQPACGPMWWLAARVLAAGDPRAEAWRAATALDEDTTPHALALCLPEDAIALVVGWPEQVAIGLRPRGDVRVLVVDADGDGAALAAPMPVWMVAGVGRMLPARLWQALVARLDSTNCPWDDDEELVPMSLVDQVVGPRGVEPAEAAVRRADCPAAPELLRELS